MAISFSPSAFVETAARIPTFLSPSGTTVVNGMSVKMALKQKLVGTVF